jgi:hypothetical protein
MNSAAISDTVSFWHCGAMRASRPVRPRASGRRKMGKIIRLFEKEKIGRLPERPTEIAVGEMTEALAQLDEAVGRLSTRLDTLDRFIESLGESDGRTQMLQASRTNREALLRAMHDLAEQARRLAIRHTRAAD